MKKNRASFFNETMDYYNTQMPNMYNPNMNLMPANGPTMSSQSGFYMGTNMMNEDLSSRLAKIERQINRLDHRVSTLEQNTTNYTTEDIDSTVNNMYMV